MKVHIPVRGVDCLDFSCSMVRGGTSVAEEHQSSSAFFIYLFMKITYIILRNRHILSVVALCLSFTFSQAQTYSTQLYQKAQGGDAVAQFVLGYCYHDGTGVTQDKSQAVYWYRKASDQGLAKAKKMLELLGEK